MQPLELVVEPIAGHLRHVRLGCGVRFARGVFGSLGGRFACQAARDEARVAEANQQMNEALLEETYLRAPFDGIVAEISEVTRKLAAPFDLDTMLNEVVDVSRNILDADRGKHGVVLVDGRDQLVAFGADRLALDLGRATGHAYQHTRAWP